MAFLYWKFLSTVKSPAFSILCCLFSHLGPVVPGQLSSLRVSSCFSPFAPSMCSPYGCQIYTLAKMLVSSNHFSLLNLQYLIIHEGQNLNYSVCLSRPLSLTFRSTNYFCYAGLLTLPRVYPATVRVLCFYYFNRNSFIPSFDPIVFKKNIKDWIFYFVLQSLTRWSWLSVPGVCCVLPQSFPLLIPVHLSLSLFGAFHCSLFSVHLFVFIPRVYVS